MCDHCKFRGHVKMSVGFFTLTSGQWDESGSVADRGDDKGIPPTNKQRALN
jgi:hypothetical protein